MKKQEFTAYIKWGYSDDDLEEAQLPSEFIRAKKVWESNGNMDEACDSLSKFLVCCFVPDNIFADLKEIIQLEDDCRAELVQVISADFSLGNLPRVKAEARFRLPVKVELTPEELRKWEEGNDMLDSGVVFEWRIPGLDDDVFLLLTNHSDHGFVLSATPGIESA